MSFSFRPAVRENVPLIVGLAGGTGSGKTMSALKLARGLAGTKPFALIDTESGRAKHYADSFQSWHHGDLAAPFSPDHYGEAITAAEAAGYGVIVVDSFSHEHAGDGGLLDMHEAELDRMAGTDWRKRDALTFAAWVKPKSQHKKLVSRLLQLRSHLIICLRAESKIEIVKDSAGKTVVRPKQTLTGLDGWVPVCEKSLPFELTVSALLTADAPGVPKPIKLPETLRAFFPLDEPIGEEAGVALAAWAAGGTAGAPAPAAAPAPVPRNGVASDDDVDAVLELAFAAEDVWHSAESAIAAHRDKHGHVSAAWLAKLRKAVVEQTAAALSEPDTPTDAYAADFAPGGLSADGQGAGSESAPLFEAPASVGRQADRG